MHGQKENLTGLHKSENICQHYSHTNLNFWKPSPTNHGDGNTKLLYANACMAIATTHPFVCNYQSQWLISWMHRLIKKNVEKKKKCKTTI